jgi:biotin operon repressor
VTDRRKRAAALRKRGLSYTEIAAALGVSKTTVYAWLNPAYAAYQRAGSREAKCARKTECPRCGALVSYDRAGEFCVACKHDERYGERNQRILKAWRAGDLARSIADREGLSTTALLSLLDYWRQRGIYEDVPLRTRRRREAWDYIQRRWNEDGATGPEIAAELGTTGANVTEMIAGMRRAGIYVERRSPSRRAAA